MAARVYGVFPENEMMCLEFAASVAQAGKGIFHRGWTRTNAHKNNLAYQTPAKGRATKPSFPFAGFAFDVGRAEIRLAAAQIFKGLFSYHGVAMFNFIELFLGELLDFQEGIVSPLR